MVKGLTKEQQIAAAKEIGCFPLRPSYEGAFDLMQVEEVGQIARAMMEYFVKCEDTSFEEEYMQMVWEIIKGDIDTYIAECIEESMKKRRPTKRVEQ